MQQTVAPEAPISLLLLFVAWLGPVLGPYALIAFAAAAGSLFALTRRPECTRLDGLVYLSLTVALAVVFVTPLAWALDHYAALPTRIVLAPLAAIVGLFRDQLLKSLGDALQGLPAYLVSLNPLGAGKGRSGQ